MNLYLNLFILLIIVIIVARVLTIEGFNLGIGKSFGNYYHPDDCRPENNCFKGSYFRTQQYHNVCPPKFGELNREPINLQDDCSRSLGDYPKPKYKFYCTIDKHLNRRCKWYKFRN